MNAPPRATQGAPTLRVRSFDLPDPASIPRWWYDDLAALTHAANAINLLFPLGERFFVRSVLRYRDQVKDPELREQLRAFAGQEAQHGRAHQQLEEVLEAQGFEIRSFLAAYERAAYGILEPMVPPILRLSTTAALEHLTATLAEEVLTSDRLHGAHPALQALLKWHAAEEIEHKAVAFDVLREVDGRYIVRIAGMAVGASTLLAFWTLGLRHLVRQDKAIAPGQLEAEKAIIAARGHSRTRFIRDGVLSYLRPGFHPNDLDNRGLAHDWLEAAGMLFGGSRPSEAARPSVAGAG